MLSVARKSVDHGELPKEGQDGWEKNSGKSPQKNLSCSYENMFYMKK